MFFPSGVMAFSGVPVRLYILEETALGLLVLVGLVLLLLRRAVNPRVRTVTFPTDLALVLVALSPFTRLAHPERIMT